MGPGGGAIGAGEPPPAAHPASMSAGTSTPALDPTLTSAPALAPLKMINRPAERQYRSVDNWPGTRVLRPFLRLIYSGDD